MTQEDYKLFTGATANICSAMDWQRLVGVAKTRLASFLCLPNGFPEQPADDLGSEQVESKHVRNFTINFKTTDAANAFAQIANQYQDIIEAYSNCNKGYAVEGDAHYCCGRI